MSKSYNFSHLSSTALLTASLFFYFFSSLAHASYLVDDDGDGIPTIWEDSNGSNSADPADALISLDGDSLSTLMEYALGGSVGVDDRNLLPAFSLVQESGSIKVEIRFSRRCNDPDLVVVPELSLDLSDPHGWSTEGLELVGSPLRNGDFESVVYRGIYPQSAVSAQFIRVRLNVLFGLLESGLGSESEISSPAVGVGGSVNSGAQFVAGQTGNAVRIVGGGTVEFPVAEGTEASEPVNLSLAFGELEFWFKPTQDSTATEETQVLFSVGEETELPRLVLYKTDRLRFALFTGGGTYQVTTDSNEGLWQAGEWVHLRAAWDAHSNNDALQVFLNGARVDKAGAPGGWAFEPLDTPDTLFLGAASSAGKSEAAGSYDELVVRNGRSAWENTNTAPYIPPVGPLFAVEGQLFTQVFSASDAEGHLVHFSLDEGAPTGLSIDSDSGELSFSPALGDAPASYTFHVRAIDQGTPQMHDVRLVTLNVIQTNPPAITQLVPSATTILAGQTFDLTLDYSDPDADIEKLEIVESNALGTKISHLGAGQSGLDLTNGQKVLTLSTASLPLGETTFSLRLVDSTGASSAVEDVVVTVEAEQTGGAAPFLNSVDVLDDGGRFLRPEGPQDLVKPRIQFRYSDADGDVSHAQLSWKSPGGVAELAEIQVDEFEVISTESGSTLIQLQPFEFTVNSPTGRYDLVVTVLDAAGNVSNQRNVWTNLTATLFFQPETPIIRSLEPSSGSWGSEVELDGYFPSTSEDPITVTLGGIQCELLLQSREGLRVLVPFGASSGPFRVETENGSVAVSGEFSIVNTVDITAQQPAAFSEPDEVTGEVEPLEDEVPPTVYPGDDFQFIAVTSVPELEGVNLSWRVDGYIGGIESTGLITPEGRYTAPASVAAPFTVTVSAELEQDASAFDSFVLQVAPRPIPPGGGLVASVAGGKILSEDFLAAIEIPAGSLPTDSEISITAIDRSNFPAPRDGRRVLGAVEFGPSGLHFNHPATITIPLARVLPEGTLLPCLIYDGTDYMDVGIVATVVDNGRSARCEVSHFSTYVVDEAAPSAPTVPPVITSATPLRGFEGLKVPILFNGTEFDTDLQIELLDSSGQPTDEMSAGPLLVEQDGRAGCTLILETLTNLGAEETRDYRIRMVRPGVGFDEVIFTVEGLDELLLSPGETRVLNNEPARTFSTVFVHETATLRVASGSLEIFSTGPVVVNGVIDASGQDGGDGNLRSGGAGAPGGGNGGNGVNETPSKLGPFETDDGVNSSNHGKNGNFVETVRDIPRGKGGRAPKGIVLDPLSLIEAVKRCYEAVLTPPLLIPACAAAASEIIDFVNAADSLANGGPYGRSGFGAPLGSSSGLDAIGGGGGSGGGAIDVNFEIPLAGGFRFQLDGGGGGGGGGGGRSVVIRSSRTLELNGLISTKGGDGGDGAIESTYELNPIGGPVIFPPIVSGTIVPVAAGGGGGGGRGGALIIDASEGVFIGQGELHYGGGRSGRGAATVVNRESTSSRYAPGSTLTDRSNGAALGARYRGPIFDSAQYQTQTTNRLVLPLRGLRPVYGRGQFKFINIYVYYGDVADRNFQTFKIYWDESLGRYDGDLLLRDGFNTLVGGDGVFKEGVFDGITILAISVDSDGDGLSDKDEEDLGTDPNATDTDGDGIDDGQEVLRQMNPLSPDSDRDGLLDGDEDAFNLDPVLFDTDGDGVGDGVELILGGPFVAVSFTDTPSALPKNTLLAGVRQLDATGVSLAVIDVGTGRIGLFGKPANGFNFGIAFDPFGALYTLSGNALSIYDPFTDVSRPVATLTGGILGSVLAYNPVDRYFYTVELGPSPDFNATGQLVRIDPSDGSTQRVGAPLSNPIKSIAFTWDGRLYAMTEGTTGDELVEMDPNLGSVLDELGSTAIMDLFGLAFSREQILYTASADGIRTVDLTNASTTLALQNPDAFFDLSVAPCPLPCLSLEAQFDLENDLTLDLVPGDFNGDSQLDFATIEGSYGGYSGGGATLVAFYDNQGSNDFERRPLASLPGDVPFDFSYRGDAADLNGDGIDDLVVACENQPGLTPVFLSERDPGTGSYRQHTRTDLTHGSAPSRWVSAAQMNPGEDSFVDLVVGTESNILVYFNSGDGTTFTPVTLLQGLDYGQSIALGDVNQDGLPDIVGYGYVFLNEGARVFRSKLAFTTPSELNQSDGDSALADFDGDGKLDYLVTMISGSDGLEFYSGDGSGGFAPLVRVSGDFFSGSARDDNIVVVDFDGNGVSEVIAGSYENGYNIYSGFPAPVLTALPDSDYENYEFFFEGTRALELADFAGTGEPQLLNAEAFNYQFFLYRLGNPFRE